MAIADEIIEIGAVGVGAVTTSMLDKGLINPFVTKLGLPASGLAGELVDAGTKWGTAMLLGAGVGMVSKRWAEPIEFGGKVIAVGTGIGAFVPGFSFDATGPNFFSNLLAGQKKAPAPQITPGQGQAAVAPGLATPGTVVNQSTPPTDALDAGF